MAALTDFHPLIRGELAGAPPVALINQKLLEVLRRFCASTKVWKETLAALNVTSGDATYVPAAPAGAEIVRIEEVYYSARLLTPKSDEDLVQMYRTRDWAAITGTPDYYQHNEITSELRLVPVPQETVTGALVVKAALMPTLTATTAPDALFAKWGEILANGVKGELMSMEGEPWYRPNRAMQYRGEFDSSCKRVALAVWRGSTKARPRAKAYFL